METDNCNKKKADAKRINKQKHEKGVAGGKRQNSEINGQKEKQIALMDWVTVMIATMRLSTVQIRKSDINAENMRGQ